MEYDFYDGYFTKLGATLAAFGKHGNMALYLAVFIAQGTREGFDESSHPRSHVGAFTARMFTRDKEIRSWGMVIIYLKQCISSFFFKKNTVTKKMSAILQKIQ